MPSQGGPESGRVTSPNNIVRNATLVGEVLTEDIATTHRLPPPNEDKRRAEKIEHEGRVTVVLRMDAEDIGSLLFAGAIDRRWETVLTESDLGAVALDQIVDDALDMKEGFNALKAGEFANLSVRLHHHEFTDEQIEKPEFRISKEFRDRMKTSYVEFRWSAHVPPESALEHGAPIKVINALVQVMKENGYERHWKTAIARFHPHWMSERDDNYLARTTDEDGSLLDTSFTNARPRPLDLSDLRAALRQELGLVLTEPRRGLKAYQESDTHIRIRLPLSEAARNTPGFAEHLAEEMHRELNAFVLDGSHHTETSEGGVRHLVLEYTYDCNEGEGNSFERAAIHHAIFNVVSSHRQHFAKAAG